MAKWFIGGRALVASKETFDTAEEAEKALEKNKFSIYLIEDENLEVQELVDYG